MLLIISSFSDNNFSEKILEVIDEALAHAYISFVKLLRELVIKGIKKLA